MPSKKLRRLCVNCHSKAVNAKEGHCLRCYPLWLMAKIRQAIGGQR